MLSLAERLDKIEAELALIGKRIGLMGEAAGIAVSALAEISRNLGNPESTRVYASVMAKKLSSTLVSICCDENMGTEEHPDA